MLEWFLGKLGIDTENDQIKREKAESLNVTRQKIRDALAKNEDLATLGQELADARNINFDIYSTDIIKELRGEASVAEIALVLSAYIAQAPLERMQRIPNNVFTAMDDLIESEREKGRFDDKTEDKNAVETVFGEIRKRLEDVRTEMKPESRGDVYNDVENAFHGKSPEIHGYALEIAGDMVASGIWQEKLRGWKILENSLSFDNCVAVLSANVDNNPDDSAQFVEKSLAILKGKVNKTNEGMSLFISTLHGQKRELSRTKNWNIVLGTLAKSLRDGSIDGKLFPAQMLDEANRFYDSNVKKIVELNQKTQDLYFEELAELDLENMSSAYALLSDQEQQELSEYLHNNSDTNRDEILQTIFSASDTSDLDSDYLSTTRGRVRTFTRDFLAEPIIQNLFMHMATAENRDKFAMELAVYSALVPFRDLDDDLKDALAAYHVKSDQRLTFNNGEWYLCSMSEYRILKDILLGNAILVNENMLVKFSGKKAALCLETYVDPTGDVFYEGVWYALTDRGTKDRLKRAFRDGAVEVNNVRGSWAVMRSLSGETEYQTVSARTMLTIAKNYAEWCKKSNGKNGVVDRSGLSVEEMNEDYE